MRIERPVGVLSVFRLKSKLSDGSRRLDCTSINQSFYKQLNFRSLTLNLSLFLKPIVHFFPPVLVGECTTLAEGGRLNR